MEVQEKRCSAPRHPLGCWNPACMAFVNLPDFKGQMAFFQSINEEEV
jgi:hypothetical protein